MVFQHTRNNIVEVKLYNISFQHHSPTNLANDHKNQQRNNNHLNAQRYNSKANMADNHNRSQQLPVVELRPFSKKVWRRENSLPDFYEKKVNTNNVNNGADENSSQPSNATKANVTGNLGLEISPNTSRLVRELTETRKSHEIRQCTLDISLGKYRNHPKAEFCHESTKTWRKQDLIPGFITRFERTRTSLECLSRENTALKQLNRLPTSSSGVNDNLWDFANNEDSGHNFKIRGGKMSQNIHRRHLLYLNPLDSYRQPGHDWMDHFNSTNASRQSTGRCHLVRSRNSFPLTSSRARELLLSGSHFNHPLKPIQREDAESPHKFNNKLGAAKCSLQILNKLGTPTSLEKAIEKEYELNLERYRRDRIFLPSDFRNLSTNNNNNNNNNSNSNSNYFNNGYIQFDSTPTIGEQLLRSAREANKSKKRLHFADDRIEQQSFVGQDSNGWYSNDVPVPDILQRSSSFVVNPSMHPINTVLHEESEFAYDTQSDVNLQNTQLLTDVIPTSGSEILGPTHTTAIVGVGPLVKANDDLVSRKQIHAVSGALNSVAGSSIPLLNTSHTIAGENPLSNQNKNDDNNNTILSPIVDSSRIETNIEYLHNLQRKSKSASSSKRPSQGTLPIEHSTNSISSEMRKTEEIEHPITQSITDTCNSNNNVDHVQSQSLGDQCESCDGNEKSEDHNIETPPSVNPEEMDTSQPQEQLTNDIQMNSDSDSRPNDQSKQPEVNSENDSKDANSITPITHNVSDPETLQQSPTRATPHTAQIDRAEDITTGLQEKRRNVTQKANSVVRSSITNQCPVDSGNVTGGTKDDRPNPEGKCLYPDDGNLSTESNHVATSQMLEKDENDKVGDEPPCTGTVIVKDTTETTDTTVCNRNDTDSAAVSPALNLNIETNLEGETIAGQSISKGAGGAVPEDEGISSATPIEMNVLNSSMTEALSDHDGNIADNGDSGISTTFITAEESRPKELEGLLV